jgi:hypothetical protein
MIPVERISCSPISTFTSRRHLHPGIWRTLGWGSKRKFPNPDRPASVETLYKELETPYPVGKVPFFIQTNAFPCSSKLCFFDKFMLSCCTYNM